MTIAIGCGFALLRSELYKMRFVLDVQAVPKAFEEHGLSTQVIAEQLKDELARLISLTDEHIPGQYVVNEIVGDTPLDHKVVRPIEIQYRAIGDINLLQDQSQVGDPGLTLEIPETHVSLQTLLDAMRSLGFGIPVIRVQASIASTTMDPELTLRITKGENTSSERIVFHYPISAIAPQMALKAAAERILESLDPLTYSAYLDSIGKHKEASVLVEMQLARGGLGLPRALNRKGIMLYDEGEYDDARELFAKAGSRNYWAPEINTGNAWHFQGYYERAIASLENVIQHEPSYALAHNNLGVVFVDQGKFDKARDEFRKALQYGDDPLYYSNLASADYHLGRKDEAVANWSVALGIAPRFVDAYEREAEAFYDDNPAAAQEAIAKGMVVATDLGGSYGPRLYLRWAAFLKDRQQSDKELSVLQEAWSKFPHNVHVLIARGDALRRSGKNEDALELYSQVPIDDEQIVDAVVGSSLCLFKLGKVESANTSLKEFNQTHQPNATVIHTQAYFAGLRGEDSTELLRAGVKTFPHSADLHDALGMILENHKAYAEAAVEYAKAIQARPRFSKAHVDLGDTLRQRGNYREAIREYGVALQLNSKEVVAHTGLARVYKSQTKWKEAEEELTTGLSLDPESEDVWRVLADLRLERDQAAGASTAYEKTLSLEKIPDPSTLMNYGLCLHKLGKLKEAESAYSKAAAIFQNRMLTNSAWAPEVTSVLAEWGTVASALGEDDMVRSLDLKRAQVAQQYHIVQ